MALTTEHDKTWIIECRAVAVAGDGDGDRRQNSSVRVRGGICVAKKGIILTTSLDITSDDLRGRNPSCDKWFDLTILVRKPNFNLVLLGVNEEVSKDNHKLRFPFFNFNNENVVNLSRGDRVYGLLHSFNKPFMRSFGHSCRPFTDRMVEFEFPSMESESTLARSGDSMEEFWNFPIPYICTKHIIEINKTDLDWKNDDDEEECFDFDFGLDDDDEDDWDNNVLNLDGDEEDDLNLDDDEENPLRFFHPDIPLIQVRGFGGGIGSEGGAVFDENNVFIGIYYFNTKCFQYILPKSFLALFVRNSIASLKKTAVSTTDASTSEQNPKDVESVINILKEAKDKKAEKLGDDQKCQVEIKEQKCGKTLLAEADDMQKLDPLVSNSFEEVAAEALSRQEYDAVKALDDLTSPVIKSEIQLDLKSKKRRRHQGNVEARVSELVSTGFDKSKAWNSQGTTSEAFGELLEKDVIAAVCEHTRCAEPTAASLNGVDRGRLITVMEKGQVLLQTGMVWKSETWRLKMHSWGLISMVRKRPSALDVVDSSPRSA